MLQTKMFEVRDRGTFIPVIATLMASDNQDDVYLLRRAGYGVREPLVLLARADGGGQAYCDPFDWGDRTRQTAHRHIETHWDELATGAVIDVEHILGETPEPKRSEQTESW